MFQPGSDQVPVAASGIAGPEDIRRSLAVGIFNFLIGESIVRSDDPAGFIRTLTKAGDDPSTGEPLH